jgi:hypothetical protein
MVTWLVLKMNRKVQVRNENLGSKTKLNTLVTVSHIGVTLVYTLTQVLKLFGKNNTQKLRMDSAFQFFGGLADMFLSVMLWFVLDNQK